MESFGAELVTVTAWGVSCTAAGVGSEVSMGTMGLVVVVAGAVIPISCGAECERTREGT